MPQRRKKRNPYPHTDAVKAVVAQIVARHPGVRLELYAAGRDDSGAPAVDLSAIVVPRGARAHGTGSAVMQAVIAAADAHGWTLSLSPATDYGASSVARLTQFYRRFGFVPNKGRNAQHSISAAMVRTARRSNPYLKKFIPPGGTVMQYVYSPQDVAKRHAEKAQRIEALKHKEATLRRSVRKDVEQGDPVALAVGLILATYERPGNADSAAEGHYGVTGWECRHLSQHGAGMAIDYVGKSGVQQHKQVIDPYLVRALRDRVRDCSRKSARVVPASASQVNRYLEGFDVSAKDLRTFGANTEMQRELYKVRRRGPPLDGLKPRDVARSLKAEFMAALGTVAARLGHTTSVLRKQYLVAGMEPQYLESGTILQAFS